MNTNTQRQAAMIIGSLAMAGASSVAFHVAVVHHTGPLVEDGLLYMGLMMLGLALILLSRVWVELEVAA